MLLTFFQALAAEMAPDTRVNCVAPGFVPTRFADFLTSNAEIVRSFWPQNIISSLSLEKYILNLTLCFSAFQRKGIEEKTLLNRLGTTEDMAAATAFLASDEASYITGETLVVGGGAPSRLQFLFLVFTLLRSLYFLPCALFRCMFSLKTGINKLGIKVASVELPSQLLYLPVSKSLFVTEKAWSNTLVCDVKLEIFLIQARCNICAQLKTGS